MAPWPGWGQPALGALLKTISRDRLVGKECCLGREEEEGTERAWVCREDSKAGHKVLQGLVRSWVGMVAIPTQASFRNSCSVFCSTASTKSS